MYDCIWFFTPHNRKHHITSHNITSLHNTAQHSTSQEHHKNITRTTTTQQAQQPQQQQQQGVSVHRSFVPLSVCDDQKTARAGEEEENEMHFATGQMTPPPRAAAGYYPLTPGAEAGGVLSAGGRPSPLVEVRPQDRVLRRTVEQNVDAVTFPTLDVPMPQKVDQPLALLLSAHFPDPEQVIEVPKISLPSRPTRRFPRILQMEENRWKCHWKLSRGCGSSSRSLTFQHFTVPLELEVFTVFTDR